MKEQIKPSVKELYSSVRAPEALRERTLAAIENGGQEKKAKILEINFKALGAIAACFVIFFGLMFSGILGGGDINISVDGSPVTADAVISRSVTVDYLPQALPLSPKTADSTLDGDALVLDVEFNGKVELNVTGATPAIENSQGQLCEISQNAEIDGDTALYLITNGAEEIEVTFTSDREVKTLIIIANSDGTYSVGIK